MKLPGRATVPIYKYFGGHGKEVMAEMQKKHGEKKGTSIFYATANKRGEKPKGEK